MSKLQYRNKILDDFFLSLGLCVIAIGVATYVLVASWQKNAGMDGDKSAMRKIASAGPNEPSSEDKENMRSKMTVDQPARSAAVSGDIATSSPSPVAKDPQVESKLNEAISRINRNDSRGAEPLLQEVLKMEPGNERALTEMAMIKMIDEHSPEEAIPYFEKAVTVNPGNEGVMEELIGVYKDAGQLEQGVDFLKKLASANPDNVALDRGVARTLVDLNRFDEAIPYLRKAAAGSREGESAAAYEELGDTYVEAGNLDGALDSYRDAIASQDNNVGAAAQPANPQQEVMTRLKYVHALVRVGRREEADETLASMEQKYPHTDMIMAIRQDIQREQGF